MEKYKLVGTFEPLGIGEQEWEGIPLILPAAYQGEDGKYYGAYIDDKNETPWAINEFTRLDDELSNTIHFIDDNTELEIDNEYYQIGDIPVVATKRENESRYIGRLDKWIDAMKKYNSELINNPNSSKTFIEALNDNIEYYSCIIAKGKESNVFENKILTKKMN